MKKRAMTLIEMLISFSLVVVLVGTLMFWYHRLSLKKLEEQKCRRPLVTQSYLHERLTRLFATPCLDSKGGHLIFGSDEEPDGSSSLIFTFDRLIDPKPQFSYFVLAKLYVHKKTLCLAMWPLPKEGEGLSPCHETIPLMEDIDRMQIAFLSPKECDFLKVNPNYIGKSSPPAGWHDRWEISHQSLPAQIRLTLQGKQSVCWTFDLQLPVIYPAPNV